MSTPHLADDISQHPAVTELAAIQKNLGIPDGDFALSIKLPYSGSSWGKIKAGTFSGAQAKAIRAVKVALATYRTGGTTEVKHGTVVFSYIRDILDAVEIAKFATDEHKLVVVCGQQGSGKTAIAKLLEREHGGHRLNQRPSNHRSYMRALMKFAAGIGVVPNFKSSGEAEETIISALKSAPCHIGIDEANYFSKEFIGFLKAILNETACCLTVFLLPHQLARMAAESAEESRQFLRRSIGIFHIPAVSSMTVMTIHGALFSHILLGENAPQITSAAGMHNHIDTVIDIFNDADPEDPEDLKQAIKRVKDRRKTVVQNDPTKN